jgi:hypothetical protein
LDRLRVQQQQPTTAMDRLTISRYQPENNRSISCDSDGTTLRRVMQTMNPLLVLVNNGSIPLPQPETSHHNMMNLQRNHPWIQNILTSVPISLPVLLVRPIEDKYKISDHQYLLRQQIEMFEAGEEDVTTHTRGRNKPITMGQVGIRCKHCAHVIVSKRQKGSTYFPSNKLGIYQAAQNMSTTHIQCGLCMYMPEMIKQQFAYIMSNRHDNSNCCNNNGAGRPYWAKSATQFGLVDTDSGIRFIRIIPPGLCITDNDLLLLLNSNNNDRNNIL